MSHYDKFRSTSKAEQRLRDAFSGHDVQPFYLDDPWDVIPPGNLGNVFCSRTEEQTVLHDAGAAETLSCSGIEEQSKTTFSTGAQKDTTGKPRFDLIPPEAMKALAEVYFLGTSKYSDRNWEKGIPFSAIIGALKRHLNSFELGEVINTADGDLEHMSHVMWWAVALVTFLRRGREDLNDLPAYKKDDV